MWVEVPWLHENLNWQLFIRSPYSCSLLQSHLEMILSLKVRWLELNSFCFEILEFEMLSG